MKKANYLEKVDETFSFLKENAIWLKASGHRRRAAYPAIR
jgi:hypothetical protein